MNEIFDKDLKFMIYGDFSTDAVYNGTEIKVLFEDNLSGIETLSGDFIGCSAKADCYPADVEGIAAGDIITINGVDYQVLMVTQEFMGPVNLYLTREF
ncbi:head-tail joining protein [Deferribacter abyssi]|uniref:head-tail joining protein n=1 Tax=Deferribacter abyssi TaxID=213806 RepID=UPI003C220356